MTSRGPKSLGLHLAAAAGMWQAGIAAAPLACIGVAPWTRNLSARGDDLAARLRTAPPGPLAAALVAQSARRLDDFLRGVELYRNHPYRRPAETRDIVWQAGTTRVLGPLRNGPAAVLVVPSLINRWHILDLIPGTGFLSRLEDAGLAPYVVDWGDPGDEEASFTMADYVAKRLEPAFDAIAAEHRSIGIAGYCLGGVLALALTQRKAKAAASVMLVATPFDFARGRGMMARLAMTAPFAEPLAAQFTAAGSVPADLVGMWLAMVEPGGVQAKFRRFAGMDQASTDARNFVAVEDWSNDGIALSNPAANEIFTRWPQTGVALEIEPEQIRVPAMVVTASRDRLVPPASSKPLAAMQHHQ